MEGGAATTTMRPRFAPPLHPPPCLPQNAMIVRCRRLPHPVASCGRRREGNLNRGRYIFFDSVHAPRDIRNSAQDDRSLHEDIWGLDPFGKQKLAYRLLKTFPRGGPLTASIWAIVTWMTGDRCLNELDCT